MRKYIVILLAPIALQLACGGGGNTNSTLPPPAVSISVSPTTASVVAGGTQQFTATVTGSTNTAVTWTVNGPGAISSAGVYTAAASLSTPASVTIKAAAQADTTKSASATISIPAVAATVLPGTASVILGSNQQFSATVSNATDKSVTWNASGAGIIDSAGLYTAPDNLATPASVSITATPNADPSKKASTTLAIAAVSVALTPGTATLNGGTSLKFAASVTNATNPAVTWSLTGNGTLDNTGLYSAPATLTNPDSATVTATAQADTGKSASVTVSLQPISLGVFGYLIMPDGGEKTLSVNSIDSATGKLRPAGLTFVNADLYTNPGAVVAHPFGKFIYTTGQQGLYGYALNVDGSLLLVPGSPFSWDGCHGAMAGAITPDGKFLYTMNDYGCMMGYGIDQNTGALTPLGGTPWSAGVTGNAMTFDAASRYLYVQNEASNQDSNIVVFSINPITGALTQIQSIVAPGTGATSGIAIVPSGKFLYVTGFSNGVVDGFTIDASTGMLTFIPGSPFPGGGYPGEGLAVDPLGKYVFAGNRGGVGMYTIDSTSGVLTEVAGSPFLVGFGGSSDIQVDPTGNFLYTNEDFTQTAVKIDRANNQLTFINSIHGRSPVPMGRWVRFGIVKAASNVAVAARFAYVLSGQDKTISSFSIDATSGELTPMGSAVSTGGINPQAMAADWYGNFLYVVNQDSNTVAVFRINSTTGALTSVSGSPFVTGPAPTGVAVEATGRVLYVGTSGDDSFYMYAINPTSGALSLLGNMPTGQCVGARTLVADWRGTTLYQTCTASSKTAMYQLVPQTGLPSTTSAAEVHPEGGPSFVVSPYGAAPPYTDLVNWHSFAFLASPTDQQIKQYIVGNGGELVLKSLGPLGPNQAVAIDPLGRFVYGTNTNANNVQADAIDPCEGTLSQVLGSPWGSGTFPIAAAVDWTGRFLYVVNRDSNTVSGFMINQATGTLTPMSSPTFTTGNKPVAILTTGTIE